MEYKDLYYQIRYDLLRDFWIWKSKKSYVNGVVLMYHHVTDEYVDIDDSCKCTIKEFQTSLDDIIEQRYQFVSIDDFYQIIEKHENKKFALLTFDDVPEDFYYNAYPILRERRIPFTLFITTFYINKEGYLGRSQMLDLIHDELCSIGAHTQTHPMLRNVKNSFDEIKQSKEMLENILHRSINYFAYPFGRQSSVSKQVMREARKAGFKCAFGTIQAPISDYSSKVRYYLPRMVYKGGKLESYLGYRFPFLNRIFGLT